VNSVTGSDWNTIVIELTSESPGESLDYITVYEFETSISIRLIDYPKREIELLAEIVLVDPCDDTGWDENNLAFLNYFDTSFISHFVTFEVNLEEYYLTDSVSAEKKNSPEEPDFCGTHTHEIYEYRDATTTYYALGDEEVNYLA
jgi:hypothetical protein